MSEDRKLKEPEALGGEGVEAPPNSLPDWDECALRVGNSDFLAKRVAEGGYGPEADSKVANELHRFIYEYDDTDPYRSAWFLHRLEKLIAWARSTPPAPEAASVVPEGKLWLWKNGDHYLAFKHLYPCFTPGGDPMTLGEPAGYAIFKPSHCRSGKEST